MAWYRSGTVSVTNGSATVTGSGTDWVAGVGIGEAFNGPDGKVYEIASIVSATQLTLGSVYLGATASGQAYQIIPSQSYIRDLAAQAAQLVSDYASVVSNAGSGKFTDGTAAAPGIRFTADENVGIRRAGADDMRLVANGQDKVTITGSGVSIPTLTSNPTLSAGTANGVLYLNGSKAVSSGSGLVFDGSNLGIGTSSPAYKLDVRGVIAGGNGTIVGGISYSTRPEIGAISNHPVGFITNNATQMLLDTSGNLGIGTSSPVAGYKTTIAGSSVWITAGSNFTIEPDVSSGANGVDLKTSFTAGGNGPLKLWTGGSERMRLDASGNLGLGVTPSAWGSGIKAIDSSSCGGFVGTTGGVNVVSNAYYNGSNWIYKTSTHASYYEQNLANQGKHAWFTAPSGTAGNPISFTQAMTLDAGGNLSVGATSVAGSETLRVYNGANSRINIDTATNGLIVGADGSGPFFDTTGSNRLAFFIAGSERARIDSSGNLLVGTTVPGYHNSNSITLEASYGYSVFNHVAGTASGNLYVAFGYGAIGAGSITQNGTTSVSYNTSSDYRLKNITGPVQNSGAYIDSLNPVEGTWKADGSTFVGLIAHEVQEVSRTQVATGEKDGAEMQAMDYSNSELTANLIAEVQALRKRVAQLEAR